MAGIDLSTLSYSATGVRRMPIKEELAIELRQAVTAVYGPDYRVDIMSAAQPEGPKGTKGTTGTRRHGTGVAADVWVYAPDGRRLSGDDLVPLSQHWLATRKGSVGFPATSGQSLHLDLIGGKGPGAVPRTSKEGALWYYGSPSKSQRSALNAAITKGTTPKYAISPEAVSRGYVPPGYIPDVASASSVAPTPQIISAGLASARANPPPLPRARPEAPTVQPETLPPGTVPSERGPGFKTTDPRFADTSGGASGLPGAGTGFRVSGSLSAEKSPALASALARLGAAVAAKGSVSLKDVVPKGPGNRGGRRSDDSDSSDGNGGSAALRLLQGGNVRTSGGVAGTVQMPRNVVPASVRQSGPTQAQVQAMRDVPKFITKTRQVPISGGSAGQKRNEQREEQQAQRNALSIGGGGTAALGVSASASGSLSLKPKAPTPQFRTETYQVPNPDYVEITVPAGPSPEQIKAARVAELRRIAEEQAAAEAARRAAAQQSANQNPAAALAYSQGKSHYTNPTTNALMPTTSISGKQRNTYGDSPRSEPVSGVSWWG